jgi:hypothetical protein
MGLCAVPWCVAERAPARKFCPIHARFGQDYRPVDELAHCETCDDSRACDECNGTGLCECHCGTEHDCGFCDGTGHCPSCHERPAPQLDPHERAYVEWALSEGLAPHPPFFSGLHRQEPAS